MQAVRPYCLIKKEFRMTTFRKNIVFVHGHGVDESIWDSIAPLLSETYTVIRPNLSLLTNCTTIDAYAEELHQFLTNAGITKCTIIGHSMGGYIGLALAEKYPEMIEGFGLFHSLAYADDEVKKEQRNKMITLLREKGATDFIRLTGANMFGKRYRQYRGDKVRQHVAHFSQLPATALAAGVEAIRDRPDRTHVLQNLDVPLLLIVGMEDVLMPFEKVIEMATFPKTTYPFILSDSGHMGMVERTDTTVKILRWYLEKIYQSI
jgi:pimeloyl-ACP methyl ester carboxylesterase